MIVPAIQEIMLLIAMAFSFGLLLPIAAAALGVLPEGLISIAAGFALAAYRLGRPHDPDDRAS